MPRGPAAISLATSFDAHLTALYLKPFLPLQPIVAADVVYLGEIAAQYDQSFSETEQKLKRQYETE